MRKRVLTGAALCALLVGVPVRQAQAQFFGLGATEITQLLNHAQLLATYVKEAQTALNSISMANAMVRNGVNLVSHPSTDIASDLVQLNSILSASSGLAQNLATMDTVFRTQYANYTPNSATTFATQYGQWSQTTQETIAAALKTAGFQAGMLNNEQLFASKVQAMASTPQGQMEALQLGNSIGAETVQQLMKLRQLMITDMSTKAAIAGAAAATQQQGQISQTNEFKHTNWTADGTVF